jgi:hypothetical protein
VVVSSDSGAADTNRRLPSPVSRNSSEESRHLRPLTFSCLVLGLVAPRGPAAAQRSVVELDHVFVVVPARAEREIAALRSAGFRLDSVPMHHAGLRTASLSVYFENAYFELLWVDPEVKVDPEWRERMAWLARAADWRRSGASRLRPEGITLQRADTLVLELELDGGERRERTDLRPLLPVIVVR